MSKRKRPPADQGPDTGQTRRSGRAVRSSRPDARPGKLRIIGGDFRGRQIEYSGDPRTRPMKDNIREAMFNLIGGWLPGKYAFDLFAGTGAIGLEALSRGATGATLIERHVPTAKLIKSNVRELEVEDDVELELSDTFFWSREFFQENRDRPTQPWIVFCSPPYAFYVDRQQEMLELIDGFLQLMSDECVMVVESDGRFDPADLPRAANWRVKNYSLAQLCIWR